MASTKSGACSVDGARRTCECRAGAQNKRDYYTDQFFAEELEIPTKFQLDYDDVSQRSEETIILHHRKRVHSFRAVGGIFLLLATVNTYGTQFNRLVVGGAQSSRIYTIDTNQRVLIRGVQANDSGSSEEKHNGNNYHHDHNNDDVLKPAAVLKSVANEPTRNNNTAVGGGDTGDHVAPTIPMFQRGNETNPPDLSRNFTARSKFLSALQ